MKTLRVSLSNIRLLIATLCAAIGFAWFASPASADDVMPLDSELVAKAFLTKAKTVRYQGGFGFNRLVDSLSVGYVEGRYTMTPNGTITRLNIDGVEIPIPKGGLKNLPPNANGQAVNYYAYAYGYDDQNENTSFARFETNELKPGDPILMLVQPMDVKKKVSFQVPVGVSADNLVLMVNGRPNTTYSTYDDAFVAWINPLGADRFDWVITDRSTGENYGNGTFNPFGPDAPTNQGSMISFAKIGGVVEVQFDARWNNSYISGQPLDGQVRRGFSEGTLLVPAKVFYLDVSDDSGGGHLEIYHNEGLAVGSGVEVFDLNADGSLSPVSLLKVGYGNGYVITPGIHGKMVITVTGSLNPDSNGFSLSFYRHSGVYYPPTPVTSTPVLILNGSN